MELEEKLFYEVEIVTEFTYFGDRVSAGRGCEPSVTARARCGWAMFSECSEFMHGRRFSLRLERAVYQSYVRPAMLYGSETWCLRECEMVNLQRTERSMVKAMYGVQLRDRKRSRQMMLMLG